MPASKPLPVACVPDAIEPAERAAHFASARELLATRILKRESLPDGLAFHLPPESLEEVSRFIVNERKCCPFITFEILVAPEAAPLVMKMRGPAGTREVLEAELGLPRACGCK